MSRFDALLKTIKDVLNVYSIEEKPGTSRMLKLAESN
jgi:hypothetical protein